MVLEPVQMGTAAARNERPGGQSALFEAEADQVIARQKLISDLMATEGATKARSDEASQGDNPAVNRPRPERVQVQRIPPQPSENQQSPRGRGPTDRPRVKILSAQEWGQRVHPELASWSMVPAWMANALNAEYRQYVQAQQATGQLEQSADQVAIARGHLEQRKREFEGTQASAGTIRPRDIPATVKGQEGFLRTLNALGLADVPDEVIAQWSQMAETNPDAAKGEILAAAAAKELARGVDHGPALRNYRAFNRARLGKDLAGPQKGASKLFDAIAFGGTATGIKDQLTSAATRAAKGRVGGLRQLIAEEPVTGWLHAQRILELHVAAHPEDIEAARTFLLLTKPKPEAVAQAVREGKISAVEARDMGYRGSDESIAKPRKLRQKGEDMKPGSWPSIMTLPK